MYTPAKTTHASPSGADLIPENRIPPAEGKETTADLAALEAKVREWHSRTGEAKSRTLGEAQTLCQSIEEGCRNAIKTGDFEQCRTWFWLLHLYFNGVPAWERAAARMGVK